MNAISLEDLAEIAGVDNEPSKPQTQTQPATTTAATKRLSEFRGYAGRDEVTEEDILTAVHESTPLHEVIGGPGASVDGARVRKRMGRPPKYVLSDEMREALATYDGTAEALNRLTVELGVPRNKILDWLKELKRRNPHQPTYANGRAREAAAQTEEPEPEPASRPVALQARRQEQPATPAPSSQTSSSSEAAPPRIALDEWLMSGADGVWLSGVLAVQPLEGGQQFAILIAHPAVPRVPGPVPGHLVSYLVGALLRKSTITGIVYR